MINLNAFKLLFPLTTIGIIGVVSYGLLTGMSQLDMRNCLIVMMGYLLLLSYMVGNLLFSTIKREVVQPKAEVPMEIVR